MGESSASEATETLNLGWCRPIAEDSVLFFVFFSLTYSFFILLLCNNLDHFRNQVLPIDGTALTDSLHSHGINCRYLGRLAQLAFTEEEPDRQIEKKCRPEAESKLPRHTMPLC